VWRAREYFAPDEAPNESWADLAAKHATFEQAVAVIDRNVKDRQKHARLLAALRKPYDLDAESE
jgi:hypothetical protein